MYIARQPILDRERRLAGFELLFRSAEPGPPRDGVLATAQVAAKAFSDPTFSDVLGAHRGFINTDADFLASELVEFLPPDRVVLEILEDTSFTPDLIARLRALRAQGYALAADDFRGDSARLAPVLDLLDIVKLDLPYLEGQPLKSLVRTLRGCALLAEKVETQAQYETYAAVGCSLFQGYFFARPEAVGHVVPDAGKLAALRLLPLAAGGASDAEIENQIKRHPELAMGLLRLVNSAAAGLSRRIVSVREALFHLGRRRLQRWLQLLVYVGASGEDPGREPLLQLAAVRGRTMETLAQRIGASGERAFTVGIASLFHVAVGAPLDVLLAQLGLDEELCAALRQRAGLLGALLAIVEAVEYADDAAVAQLLARVPSLTPQDLFAATREALAWAGRM